MHPQLSAWLGARLIDRSGGFRTQVLELYRLRCVADRESRALLDQRRDATLAGFLNHARATVPHFRALPALRAEVTPARAMQVLRDLPVMRRADLQAQPARYVAEGATGLIDDFTGGSSGTPLRFKVDRATQQAREASLRWANHLAGGATGDRVAMLWGADRDVKLSMAAARHRLRCWIDNLRWYNAFNMGADRMQAFHRDLSRFRPHLIVAYAGSLHTYARFLEEQGITPGYPMTGLVSSAECLTPPMRETIERVFRKRVFDRYGNREAGAIAAECEAHQGLHINETDFVVEIDSRDPFNESGPLLITYLANRAMPLIRYDTGDLGVWRAGDCSCGRHTARLARVVGRQSDTIRTASGKLIHGEYFTHALYGAEGVQEFQFVQETLHRYRLLVVADAKDPSRETVWRQKIISALDADDDLQIEYRDVIPALSSGKRKFTLSLLSGER